MLHWFIEAEITTMDSGKTYDTLSGEAVAYFADTLYRLDQNAEPIPNLAAALSEISEDGLTVTVTIRDDAYYANGEKIVAADIEYAVQRVFDPTVGSQNTSITAIKNKDAVRAGELPVSELGVKALSDTVIEFTLEAPDPYITKKLADTAYAPVNRAFAEEKCDQYGLSADNLLASGAYSLADWNGTDISWRYVRNPYYWDKDNVYFDVIDIQIVKDANTAINLYEAGQLDGVRLTSDYIPLFEGQPDLLKKGPVIVFLAEYDVLTGIGHACGHNLFGAASLLAAAALKQVIDETGGEVRVYGTPGEEGGEYGNTKGSFVREGFFKDVDAALCVHPGADKHLPTTPTLGCAPVDIEFWGKPAHAASAPEKGVNALDALILTFNGMNALRQHVTDDVRIHGIITHGGDAPNIVPEYAAGKFYFRAARMDELHEKLLRIVDGAAAMSGAKGGLQPYQNRVENTVITPSFDALYRKHLTARGETMAEPSEKTSLGSSDVGNVSQVIPTIQPTISIMDVPTAGHSEAFKAAACSRKGLSSIPLGAKALALTALDLLTDPQLLSAIRIEHAQQLKKQQSAAL